VGEVVVVVAGTDVVVPTTVVVVAPVVVVVGATVVVVGATEVVVVGATEVVVVGGGSWPSGAGNGWMLSTTKLLLVQFDGSLPTQIEQGTAVPASVFWLPFVVASSQVTVEEGSKPGWL
jgi:hypothetical protein